MIQQRDRQFPSNYLKFCQEVPKSLELGGILGFKSLPKVRDRPFHQPIRFFDSQGGKISHSSASPTKPRRFNIPFLLDLVIVSDPEQIKKIEISGAVDRVHAYEMTDRLF